MVAGKRERRYHRFRLVLVAPIALLGGAAVMASAASWVGAVALPVPAWAQLAAGVVLVLVSLVVWPRPDPGRWARGAAGERATAALLERLPSGRWFVLHDLALPGSRANVDHLVIGPTGVWVVDTKAYRARVKARWGRVLVGGVPLSTAAVRWEAGVVAGLLGVEVRPVVAVHGRGLPRRGRRCEGALVVPAARLVRRLRRGYILRPALGRRQAHELAELAAARLC